MGWGPSLSAITLLIQNEKQKNNVAQEKDDHQFGERQAHVGETSSQEKRSKVAVMRIVLLGLSALAVGLATRRFYLTEHIGYDTGALFFLLVGIQLFVAAMLFGERSDAQDSPSPPASAQNPKDPQEEIKIQ